MTSTPCTAYMQCCSHVENKSIFMFGFDPLQHEQLLVGQSEANGGELGVYSKAYLKVNTVFEPLSGPSLLPEDVTTDINSRFLWPIYDEEGNISVLLDLSNEDSSTWLRYMNPAPKQGQQNVEVRFVQNTIFFVTMKNIRPGNELLYWFSPPYCKMQYLQPDPERQPMRFECDKCKVQFDSPLYAHRHITIFHPYGLKRDKHTCYICKEVIYGKKKLIEHMEKQHGTKAGWQCEECGKAVHSRSYLKEHKRKVHQSEEKARRYRCQQCGKRFKCRAHLRRHVECVHVRNFKWECEYCNKKFSLKKYLEKHVRAHKGEFPFVCDKCSKGFFDSHGLKVHLLTHSGVRPYRCTLCAMSTSTKQRLQIHFKKAHGFTDENMPQIKRQVELTLNSSPIGGFKEREKVPRQRIFRTRPIDKSVTGDRGMNNATQDKDVCQTVENLAVNTLLHSFTCNNNNEENSEQASDSNVNQNNSQANNNQSNSIDERTSLSPANSNRVVPSTDHARPILQQKSTAVRIHRHNAENTRPTFPITSQSLTTGTACNIQNMENTRPTLLSASQISTTETVHIQNTDTTRPTLPNTAQSSTIHLQNTENMRPTFSTMPPCSTTETDDVSTTRPVLQQTSPTTNTTCVNSNVVVDYPHSEHSYTPNGNNNNSMLPVSTHQENVNTSQQRRMCTSTSGILPQPTNQQRSTSMSGTLPHPTNQQTSTSTSGILSLPTNQETSTSTSGILPQPTNQQTSTSTSGILPPPTVSYNVLPPDYYNSNVGNYQSDTPIEPRGFTPLPTVQNSVTNYPPTYQGAGVPYPNTSQLTPHTIPLSSYTVNQTQWQ
ncbi:uncharacterized protein LOC144435494 [Glandiceps talaboti]